MNSIDLYDSQIAIARFFDGEPPPEAEAPPPPPPQSSRRQETLANGFSELRHRARHSFEPAPRVVGQPENRINPRPPLLLSALLTPLNFAVGLFTRLYSVFAYLFPFLPRLLFQLSSRAIPALHRHTRRRPALSPYETAVRFQREFTKTYGDHPLPLLECSYARAYDLAKSDLKFLLVVPLSPEHSRTDRFVRQVLLSPRVVEYFTEPDNNVLLWAGSVADSEPFQVATELGMTRFPSAVLIAHTPSVSSTAMSIVARISNPQTAEEFVNTIRAATAQNGDALASARANKTEQQATRSLRDEQNSAYERSLAQDREKARARKAAEEEKVRQAMEEKNAVARQARYEQDLAQWKRWRAAQLASEPEQGAKDTVRTSIRLLDGEKVMRRFQAGADIEEVYAFVECHEELKRMDAGFEEKIPDKPASFEHTYGFQLVSPMPREVYKIADGGTVGKRLGRSANLIAERIEDDDDSDV